MKISLGNLLLAKVLARPSSMNGMLDSDIVEMANSAANSSVEKFFLEQITSASVDVKKSSLAQLALMNRSNAKAA